MLILLNRAFLMCSLASGPHQLLVAAFGLLYVIRLATEDRMQPEVCLSKLSSWVLLDIVSAAIIRAFLSMSTLLHEWVHILLAWTVGVPSVDTRTLSSAIRNDGQQSATSVLTKTSRRLWSTKNLMANTTLLDWMESVNPFCRIPPSFNPHVNLPHGNDARHGSVQCNEVPSFAEAVTRHAGWLFSVLLAALSVLANSDYLFSVAPFRSTWLSGGSNSALSHHSPHMPTSTHRWLPLSLDVQVRVEDAVLGVVLCAVCAISTDLLGFGFNTPTGRFPSLSSAVESKPPASIASFFCGNFGCLLSASADGSR